MRFRSIEEAGGGRGFRRTYDISYIGYIGTVVFYGAHVRWRVLLSFANRVIYGGTEELHHALINLRHPN